MTSLLTRLSILLCTLAISLSVPGQDKQNHRPVRYSLRVIGTLGGTFSEAHGLNNKGSTAGQSLLIDSDFPLHAFFWQKGAMVDLGTLGGQNSLVPVANHTVNERDAVIGNSETSTPDPNGEDLCGLGTFFICLPFVWQEGVLTALPTLGGNNGNAGGINNRGQIVGTVETPNFDPCSLPFAEQIQAVIWEHGVIQEVLPPLGGTAAAANAINDNGQVVGESGCVSDNTYAVLWQHGRAINLGSLGGVTGNLAFDINNEGQVVGQSDLPGDTVHHAFFWQNGVMTDLGSLSDALPNSQAIGINNQGQVVGFSQDAAGDEGSSVAVLWENGTITDLNTVIAAGSSLFLMEATAINDRGEIAGFGRLPNNPDDHRGFILIPCHAAHSGANVCEENSK
jgi:probable HAF family extracellular repeat protein